MVGHPQKMLAGSDGVELGPLAPVPGSRNNLLNLAPGKLL